MEQSFLGVEPVGTTGRSSMKSYPKNLILALSFVMGGVLLCHKVLLGFFLSDDFVILHAVSRKGPLGVWTYADPDYFGSDFFRPVISALMFVQYKIWGLNPFGFHLTEIVLHSLNALILTLVIKMLISHVVWSRNRQWIVALFGGVLFLTHYSHSEAISWIAGTPDVLATFFALLSLHAYLHYRGRPNLLYLMLSLVLYACSLFSKEAAIALPFVLFAYEACDYLGSHDRSQTSLRRVALPVLHCIVLASYLTIRRLALGTFVGGYGSQVHLGLSVKGIIRNLTSFGTRTLLPAMSTVSTAVLVFGLLMTLIITSLAFAIRKLKRKPSRVLYFTVVAYLLSVVPVINLRISKVDTQGERLIYFPSVFGVMFLALLLNFLIRDIKRLVTVFVFVSILMAASLQESNENWKEAGEISQSIAESISDLGQADRLLIVNLPDNIRGAYIYRNGIREAIDLYHRPSPIKTLIVAAYTSIKRRDDTVTIVTEGGMHHIEQTNPEVEFYIPNLRSDGKLSTDDLQVSNFGQRSYVLRVTNHGPSDKLTLYSNGRLIAYQPAVPTGQQ